MKVYIAPKEDLKVNKMIHTFFPFFRKNKRKIITWILLVFLSMVCCSISDFNSKEAAFENFCSTITNYSKNSKYRHINFSLFPKENRDGYSSMRNFYAHNNFTYNNANTTRMNYLSINANLYPTFKISTGADEVYNPISLLSPRVMSVNERNDFFYMDVLKIKTYYKPNNNNKDIIFCYISDKYAKTLLNEWKLDDQSQLLGKYLYTSYQIDAIERKEKMMITNIFYSEELDAPYYHNLYDNFVISYLLNYRDIHGMGISIDLAHTFALNQAVFYSVEDSIFSKTMDFSFINGREKKQRINQALNDEYIKYLSYQSRITKSQKYTVITISLLCYLFSQFILMSLIDRFPDESFSERKRLSFGFAAILYIIFSFLYLLYEYVLNKFVLITSKIYMNLLIMIVIIYVMSLMIMFINRRMRGKTK